MSEITDGSKSTFLVSEVLKIEDKLRDFYDFHTLIQAAEKRLDCLKSKLRESNALTDEIRMEINASATELRSTLADLIKAHRDVHPPISKFGKFIDKNCAQDTSILTSYFVDRTQKQSPNEMAKVSAPSDGDSIKSAEDSLRLIIIEHLLRQGRDTLASNLVEAFGFAPEDVDLDKFRGLSNLILSIHRGDIAFARNWLSEHRDQLGSQADELQYTLVKLEFLSAVKQHAHDPASVLNYARQLVPFAATYTSDFEHLMGSLVFLGRSLESTPYEDLAFTPLTNKAEALSNTAVQQDINGDTDSPIIQASTLSQSNDTLLEAANLFRASYCHRLNLSNVDPLCTVFGSGCRLLSRQQQLQRALSCLTKYSSTEGDTLPIAVELDPLAHRHNIFHCPVIKEVITTSNCAVRLSCGHAISRDAFESLPNTDRRSYGLGQSNSKVKCPYCPMETYRNQAMDLIF